MPPAGFEPAIPAGERLQTHTLDRPCTFYFLQKETNKRFTLLIIPTLPAMHHVAHTSQGRVRHILVTDCRESRSVTLLHDKYRR